MRVSWRASGSLDQARRETELPPDDFIPTWLPTLFTSDAPQHLLEEAAEVMRDFHPAGTRTAAFALGTADFRPLLPSVAVPTLLLYGSEDVRSPAATVGADLAAAVPGSRLEVIAGMPHLLHLQAPDAFNDAVRTFLREHDGP